LGAVDIDIDSLKQKDTSSSSPSSPAPIPARKEKKNKKAKADGASDRKGADEDGDVSMQDAPAAPPQPAKSTTTPKAGGVQQTQDEFSALYLRKIAAEFADDLDKVREAQDFKASSVPMLIHALKQGESLFTPEEKRRVVGAANA
jgi:ribosome assembly protein 3